PNAAIFDPTVDLTPAVPSQQETRNSVKFENVDKGSYSLKVSAGGYVSETQAIQVGDCKTDARTVRLKKKPIIKVMDIKDEDGLLIGGVNVEITNMASGTSAGSNTYQRSPLYFKVDPGAFTVKGTDIGAMYEPASEDVNADAGKEVEVHLI